MKYRKIALLLIVVLLGCCCLTACKHVHTFEEDWQFDEKFHWRVATCEDTDEQFDKDYHDFDEEGYCVVCGFYRSPDWPFIVDEETWKTELSNLMYTDNVTVETAIYGADYYERNTIRLNKDVAYVSYDTSTLVDSDYVYFSEEGTKTYRHENHCWRYEESSESSADLLKKHLVAFEDMLLQIVEGYSTFIYNRRYHIAVWYYDDMPVGVVSIAFLYGKLYSIDFVPIYDNMPRFSMYAFGKTEVDMLPSHHHTYERSWSYNNVYHWHKTTCDHNTVDAYLPHQLDGSGSCSVCDYVKIEGERQADYDKWHQSLLKFYGYYTNWTVATTVNGVTDIYKSTVDGLYLQIDGEDKYYQQDGENVWLYSVGQKEVLPAGKPLQWYRGEYAKVNVDLLITYLFNHYKYFKFDEESESYKASKLYIEKYHPWGNAYDCTAEVKFDGEDIVYISFEAVFSDSADYDEDYAQAHRYKFVLFDVATTEITFDF